MKLKEKHQTGRPRSGWEQQVRRDAAAGPNNPHVTVYIQGQFNQL
jgi:hypothetical protein